MQKRGQVTIFIVVGIIILVLVVLAFYFYREAIPIVQKPFTESEDVREYVQSCVDQTVSKGIETLAKGEFASYEQELESYINTYLALCLDFSAFPDLVITYKGDVSSKVSLSDDMTFLDAVVFIPITVQKGKQKAEYESFQYSYDFQKRDCVHIRVDANCQALESKTTKAAGIIWTYNVGDYVMAGGNCIAC